MEPFTIPHPRRWVSRLFGRGSWCWESGGRVWGETLGRNVGARGLPANGNASSTCTRQKDEIMDTTWRALGLAAGAMQKYERDGVLQRCWPETWRRDVEESSRRCPEAQWSSAAVLVTDCNLELPAGLMTWLVPRCPYRRYSDSVSRFGSVPLFGLGQKGQSARNIEELAVGAPGRPPEVKRRKRKRKNIDPRL
jgi:hypothetical protein